MLTNALDFITIKGFKSIASIERLPLKALNVVIGPNGSGKSNFIEVFEFFRQIREGTLKDYVNVAGSAERILHFGSRTTKEIVFDLGFAQGQHALQLRPTAEDGLYLYEEVATGNPGFNLTSKKGANKWRKLLERRLG